jgi:hypothetical protein
MILPPRTISSLTWPRRLRLGLKILEAKNSRVILNCRKTKYLIRNNNKEYIT